MKARSAYRRAQMRAYSVKRSRRMGVMPRAERRITNRSILATIKQEIGEWASSRLHSAAQPRRIIHLASLPRNANGKLERSTLRRLANEVPR